MCSMPKGLSRQRCSRLRAKSRRLFSPPKVDARRLSGAAEARERQAEAEAKATTFVSEAIGHGSIQAINYFVAQRYIDAIGRLAGTPNQKVILMPLESASMIGSLAGIAEVARESFVASRAAPSPAVAGPSPGAAGA